MRAFHKDYKFFKRRKIIRRMAVLMHWGKTIGRDTKAGKAEKGPDCSLKYF